MNNTEIPKIKTVDTGEFKGLVVGSYDDINGSKAIPLKDVNPTEGEIMEIIKYHFSHCRHIETEQLQGRSGSWEIRQYPYSVSRIEYYSQFVDKSEVDKVKKSVYEGFDPNAVCIVYNEQY